MTYPFPYSQAAKPDSRITIPRPVYDSFLAPMLDSASLPEEFSLNLLRGYVTSEHSIQGPDNNTLILSVFAPKEASKISRPVLYHIHGGGMVSGDRFTNLTPVIELLEGIDCVVVSVEHRLSPETLAPRPAEDCYAGILWVSENAAILGIEPAVIVVFGVSGGGGLAAAACLMARDRKSPKIPIKAQMLFTPQLDDRCESLSHQQFEYGNPVPTPWLRSIWKLVLGESYGTNDVTPYQAPSRATDLSDLPPAYIDAAECEVFRDPAVAYATNMWRGGSTCELHIWPGAFHAFDMLNNSDVLLIHISNESKRNWFQRYMKPQVEKTAVGLHC